MVLRAEREGAFHRLDICHRDGKHLLGVRCGHATLRMMDVYLVQELPHLSGIAPFLLVTMVIHLRHHFLVQLPGLGREMVVELLDAQFADVEQLRNGEVWEFESVGKT